MMRNQYTEGRDVDWTPELETCVALPGALAHAESCRQSVSDAGVVIALMIYTLSDG